MNKKAFIKWQIKELLPIYVICFVLICSIYWLSILGTNLCPKYSLNASTGIYEKYGFYFPPIYGILIPALLASTAIPFSAFSYQTSRIRADFFYQIPLKEKELRRIRLLTSLIILLIIITIAYMFGVLFMFTKQLSTNSSDEYLKTHNYYYNYWYVLLYYPILIILISLHYFTCSYFLSLGTRVIDSILYLILGEGTLTLTFEAFIIMAYLYSKADCLSDLVTSFLSPSFVESYFVTYCLGVLMMKNEIDMSGIWIVSRIISSLGFFLLGGLCSYLMLFKKKDPSGEYAGKGLPTNLYTSLYPHAFMLVAGLYCSVLSATFIRVNNIFFVEGVMSFLMWATAYYFSIVGTNRGFHFEKRNWLIFGSVVAFILIMTVFNGVYFGTN